MKTIKLNSGEVKRVSDEKAGTIVKNNDGKYIPKSIWKTEVRDKK
jgi:hypothetical protein